MSYTSKYRFILRVSISIATSIYFCSVRFSCVKRSCYLYPFNDVTLRSNMLGFILFVYSLF